MHSHQQRGYIYSWQKACRGLMGFLTPVQATAGLLEADPSLWCVSSWNDNGLATLGWKPDRLVR